MWKLQVNDKILLKELGLKDVAAIFNTIDTEREYLGKWLPFVELTKDVSYTRTFVENYIDEDERDLTCAIYYETKFVGIIGLKDTDFDNLKTEIGYWLSELYQGKGIITQSCKALINYVFEELNLNRVQIKAASGNLKSCAIPERLGFNKEGIERDGELHSYGFVDLVIFGLLKKDWLVN